MLFGVLQWVVTLGCFKVRDHIMTLARFRIAPREGHMTCARRVVGYLCKMKHGKVRFRTKIPDYPPIPDEHYR